MLSHEKCGRAEFVGLNSAVLYGIRINISCGTSQRISMERVAPV